MHMIILTRCQFSTVSHLAPSETWHDNHCLIIDKISMVSKLSNIIDQERQALSISPLMNHWVDWVLYWSAISVSFHMWHQESPASSTHVIPLKILPLQYSHAKAISWVNLLQQTQHRDNPILTFKNPNKPSPLEVPRMAGNRTIVLQVFRLRTWKWLFRHNRGFKQQCSHHKIHKFHRHSMVHRTNMWI